MRTSIAAAVVLTIIGLGLTLPAGATARASRDEETARTTVHFGDLDLQSYQGASALYSRLSQAASRVCSAIMEPYVRMTRAYHTCHSEALSKAVQQVDRPLLTQIYDRHLPKEIGTAHHAAPHHAPHT
jgi:UrcA family protein